MSEQSTPVTARPRDGYDAAWKAAIERFTEAFMALLFPEIHRGIDWSVPPEFLDQELLPLTADERGAVRRGVVDRLFRVRRVSGEDAAVLVHVEVQARQDERFAERMFFYHYRIYDKHAQLARDGRAAAPPVSLAVLADDRRAWRPACYDHGLWGCELLFAFPTVKLLDFAEREAELEASSNPFAQLVLGSSPRCARGANATGARR